MNYLKMMLAVASTILIFNSSKLFSVKMSLAGMPTKSVSKLLGKGPSDIGYNVSKPLTTFGHFPKLKKEVEYVTEVMKNIPKEMQQVSGEIKEFCKMERREIWPDVKHVIKTKLAYENFTPFLARRIVSGLIGWGAFELTHDATLAVFATTASEGVNDILWENRWLVLPPERKEEVLHSLEHVVDEKIIFKVMQKHSGFLVRYFNALQGSTYVPVGTVEGDAGAFSDCYPGTIIPFAPGDKESLQMFWKEIATHYKSGAHFYNSLDGACKKTLHLQDCGLKYRVKFRDDEQHLLKTIEQDEEHAYFFQKLIEGATILLDIKENRELFENAVHQQNSHSGNNDKSS